MEQYIIKGGNPLVGEVVIGGAKNAALGILAAAIMTDGECLIDNMPNVRDNNVLLQAMEGIGATIDRKGDNEVVISGKNIDSTGDLIVDNEYIRKIRASYYLIGALLGKYRKAQVVLPGGCDIGSRPIDQHIKGFRALGAEVKIEHGMIIAQAEQLVGNRIYLDVVSVGATINIMMAASLAQGNTVIENAAKEGNHLAEVALDAFVYRVAKYVGAYTAAMNGVDAIAFTAGVGENDKATRKKVCEYLGYLGVKIDDAANDVRGKRTVISAPDSKVKVMLIPTNEELAIARETLRLVK